jgi:hypothetical protein
MMEEQGVQFAAKESAPIKGYLKVEMETTREPSAASSRTSDILKKAITYTNLFYSEKKGKEQSTPSSEI